MLYLFCKRIKEEFTFNSRFLYNKFIKRGKKLMDYSSLGEKIFQLVGGESNIEQVTHCATRLRFNLKDTLSADEEAIKELPGVLGIAKSNGQFQVIIGNDVAQVYKGMNLSAIVNQSASDNLEDNSSENKSIVSVILDTLSGIFTPIMPAMVGGAMIKAVLIILTTFGWMSNDSQTYIIFSFVSDAAFYFLPMLLAWSAATKFKVNVGLAIVLAGILLHPNFSALLNGEETVTLLGLPVTKATYSSSVIPIILSVWVMSYVEPLADRVSPSIVKTILKPLLIILVMTPLTLLFIGPLGVILGNYTANFVAFINVHVGWLVSGIVGATFPFLIMTGMHYSLGPIAVTAYTTTGLEGIIGPGMLMHSLAQGGAALAVALKTKDKSLKQVALSSSATAVLGVTEPALFGVTLRFKKALLAVIISGGISGIYVGAFGVARSAMGITGLATLPAFITDSPMNLVHAIIGCIIAFASAFILTIIFGFEDVVSSPDNSKVSEISSESNDAFITPLKGNVISLEDVKDETFASGIMGQGMAIIPTEGTLVSPVNGVVTMLYPSLHAIGLTTADGKEILIHIGMDTVELNGRYFKAHVQANDTIKVGQKLITFDINGIQSQGYDLTTPVIITNSSEYGMIKADSNKDIDFGDTLFTFE